MDDEAHRHRKATFVKVCYDDAQVERRVYPCVPMLPAFARTDFEQITSFVPQGGMDVATGHRCPGEKIAARG